LADSQVYLAQRENDRRFSGELYPNREECFMCHRVIQQDDSTRRWFLEDDAQMGEHYCLTFCDSLDAFETQGGWCCSTICWNENCALNEDESIPVRPVLFLVKAVTA
jgi:hypothetical protein